MKSRFFCLLCLASLVSACSTYKTNTETTFDSVLLSGKTPVIHVGDIDETPDKLTLLGWVDATVTKPNWFSDNPTEDQANIILAEKGDELGADAIIYVTYKTALGSSLLTKIEARGQAVKLKNDAARLAERNKKQKTAETSSPSTTDITKTADPQLSNDITKSSGTEEKAAIRKNRQQGTQDIDIPTTVEEIVQLQPSSTLKVTAPISLKEEIIKKEKENALAKANVMNTETQSCAPTLNDIAEYENNVDAVNYMIMNADFLLKKSRGIKDKEMESASLRLIHLLEQQLEKVKLSKPVESR